MPHKQPVFVVSAPSGTGKTTLNRLLVERHPHIEIAVSLTTRACRTGEIAGRDYHFVSRDVFMQHVQRGEMLEWAEVHGNLYGSSLVEMAAIHGRKHIPLLEIDVQGWEQARAKLNDAIAVFILPPSIEDLWHRLENRGTDSEATRWRRLMNAKREIEHAEHYQHFIVNDQVDPALQQLVSVLVEGKSTAMSHDHGLEFCNKLLRQFSESALLRDLKTKYPSS